MVQTKCEAHTITGATMIMRTVRTKVFKFDELTPGAQKKAAKLIAGYPDHWTPIPERLEEIYKLIRERDLVNAGNEYEFLKDGSLYHNNN